MEIGWRGITRRELLTWLAFERRRERELIVNEGEDRLEQGRAFEPGESSDRAISGVDLSAPFGAEPIRHPAEDDRRTDISLRYEGGVHVSHLRFSSAAYGKLNPGLPRKPHDKCTQALCPEEHRRQHAGSEQAYWAELGIDPHRLAQDLWAISPDQEEMRRVLSVRSPAMLSP